MQEQPAGALGCDRSVCIQAGQDVTNVASRGAKQRVRVNRPLSRQVTRYLTLGEYFWLAEQVTVIDGEVLNKASRADLADSALHGPQAGFGEDGVLPATYTTRQPYSSVVWPGTIPFRTGINELPGQPW